MALLACLRVGGVSGHYWWPMFRGYGAIRVVFPRDQSVFHRAVDAGTILMAGHCSLFVWNIEHGSAA